MDTNKGIFRIDVCVSLIISVIFIISFFVHTKRQKMYKARMLGGLVYPTAFTIQCPITDKIW